MSDALLHFVHITDTHLSHDPAYTYDAADYTAWEGAQLLVRQLNALPFTPDFILHTGDVAFDPEPEAYETIRKLFASIEIPIYYLAGNHDHGATLVKNLMQHQQSAAENLLYYEFEKNGVQIVCLDTNAPLPEGYKPPNGRIDEAQIEWLKQVARPDDPRPLVVAVHHNPIPTGIPWLDNYMGLINGMDLHRALVPLRDRIRGVFHGHIHMNLEVFQDGILYVAGLSSWYQLHAWPHQTETEPDRNAEPGFNVVTVKQNQTIIRRHRFESPLFKR